jgi:hypothetical protein
LDSRWKFNTARSYLAGAGIQTAALAFGGTPALQQMQQKNMMEQIGIIQFFYGNS